MRRQVPPWLCATINLLAFPGLGTILSRRKHGYVQASLMLAGFVLTMGYLLSYLAAVAQYLQHPSWTEEQFQALYRPHRWAIVAGLPLCGCAWLWALVSSRQLMRDKVNSTFLN